MATFDEGDAAGGGPQKCGVDILGIDHENP